MDILSKKLGIYVFAGMCFVVSTATLQICQRGSMGHLFSSDPEIDIVLPADVSVECKFSYANYLQDHAALCGDLFLLQNQEVTRV